MRSPYLAVFGDATSLVRVKPVAATLAGGAPRTATPQFLLFSSAPSSELICADPPFLLMGRVFRHESDETSSSLSTSELDVLNRSEGKRLFLDYWGEYLSIQVGTDRLAVARSPFGGVPAYYASGKGVVAVSSEADWLVRLGLSPGTINWTQTGKSLAIGALRNGSTSINGVSEIVPSAVTYLSPVTGARTIDGWSPWSFTSRHQAIDDLQTAQTRIRQVAAGCIAAWGRQAERPMIELSGGVDSSTVAVALAEAGILAQALTLRSEDGGADERIYAEAVAERAHFPLVTQLLDPCLADIGHAPSRLLPRPSVSLLHQAVDKTLLAGGQALDCDAFLSGGGGDNVFCSLNTAAPAADAFLRTGPSRLFVRTLADVARLHNITIWTAMRLSFRKVLRRHVAATLSRTPFLHPDFALTPPNHPWLDAPRDILPGQREHVAALVPMQGVWDEFDRGTYAPVYLPLLSQPLVEACLRIPTWLWVQGGRNRAVARAAFSDLLPSAVRFRRSKGNFTVFGGDMFERNRADLKDRLLGGNLSAAGLLDRAALETYLTHPLPSRDDRYFAVFGLASAEMWSRDWTSRVLN